MQQERVKNPVNKLYLELRPDFMLAHQCAMRRRSPELFLARRLNFETLCLQSTPSLLANPLRPGLRPSAKFSQNKSESFT